MEITLPNETRGVQKQQADSEEQERVLRQRYLDIDEEVRRLELSRNIDRQLLDVRISV